MVNENISNVEQKNTKPLNMVEAGNLLKQENSDLSLQGMEPCNNGNVVPGTRPKAFTLETLPHNLLHMEYAVRGAIVDRAEELKNSLRNNPEEFCDRFTEIIPANIGNPQAVGQKPITFNRQVLSCLINPALLDEDYKEAIGLKRVLHNSEINDDVTSTNNLERDEIMSEASTTDIPGFPFLYDVRARAHRYLSGVASIGAYSHSQGVYSFRKDIAEWFERRDSYPCDASSIFLTDGASAAIRLCLEMLIKFPTDGILIPVPQYPLYSATITRLKGTAVQYFLNESLGWRLTLEELNRAITDAKNNGVDVKAIVIINPGNPTGSLLQAEEIINIITFSEKENLVILADEVYQENIYTNNNKFISMRKILKQLNSYVPTISFHSSSKGLAGECGIRGGLMQLENVDPNVVAILYKLACVSLCSNTIGQAMMTCLVTPPLPGDPSYESYMIETKSIYNSLKCKAQYAYEKLNKMEGVSCQIICGAMYAFPRITLPQSVINMAIKKNISPDMFYCMEMLENTGIICVPGSGFDQYPGTYHFRVTILPSFDKFIKMLDILHIFHNKFLKKYND